MGMVEQVESAITKRKELLEKIQKLVAKSKEEKVIIRFRAPSFILVITPDGVSFSSGLLKGLLFRRVSISFISKLPYPSHYLWKILETLEGDETIKPEIFSV
ncbi:hypothetical protein H5T58_02110 [Candidatus Parcubacteria bacterium]|nr:hypothetical protein [Candidatus Parcubacteria bacterium]